MAVNEYRSRQVEETAILLLARLDEHHNFGAPLVAWRRSGQEVDIAAINALYAEVTAFLATLGVCPLCGLPNQGDEVHGICHDREQWLADQYGEVTHEPA